MDTQLRNIVENCCNTSLFHLPWERCDVPEWRGDGWVGQTRSSEGNMEGKREKGRRWKGQGVLPVLTPRSTY